MNRIQGCLKAIIAFGGGITDFGESIEKYTMDIRNKKMNKSTPDDKRVMKDIVEKSNRGKTDKKDDTKN